MSSWRISRRNSQKKISRKFYRNSKSILDWSLQKLLEESKNEINNHFQEELLPSEKKTLGWIQQINPRSNSLKNFRNNSCWNLRKVFGYSIRVKNHIRILEKEILERTSGISEKKNPGKNSEKKLKGFS